MHGIRYCLRIIDAVLVLGNLSVNASGCRASSHKAIK